MTMLSKRLSLVAEMIQPGSTVADIGGDHARLARYLAEQGICRRVITSELGPGPWTRARNAIQASPARARIELRCGNGLQVLRPGEVDQIVLAGMGGDTIVGILGYDWGKAASFQRFLFQPMTRARTLRKSLAEQGWSIEDEGLVREEQRLYVIIAARPGQSPQFWSPLQLEAGPVLLTADDPLQREYLGRLLHRFRTVHQQMINSSRPDIQAAAAVYRENIDRLEEILDAGHSEGHN